MAKIEFDENNIVTIPTLILQNRNFDSIGSIPSVFDLTYKENFNSANEISFTIYKYIDGKCNPIWDSIVDFKVLYVPEFNERFEIHVSVSESDTTRKCITASSLCEAELSNIKLYDIEINTDSDITREDSKPTVFYHPTDTEHSLLHRILEKAPHYSIGSIDGSLMNIQRFFSISDTDIYSELTGEISEKFHCIFLFDSMTRTISAYDLDNYGKDTTVFISNDNLSTEINLETNKDSLKNCFYVEGGDDIMTAAIRSINPNGSQYIFNITDDMKKDMPNALSTALDEYSREYEEYNTTHVYPLPEQAVGNYNAVVDYVNKLFFEDGNAENENTEDSEDANTDKNRFTKLPEYALTGYPSTTAKMYEAIDLYEFINNSMMPTIDTSGLGIQESMQAIIDGFKNGFNSNTIPFTNEIALNNHTTAIDLTVESAIKKIAKIFYSPAYYDFSVETLSYEKASLPSSTGKWEGTFTLTSISEKDENNNKITLTTGDTEHPIELLISGNYTLFIEQAIYRAMSDKDKVGIYDITNVTMDEDIFQSQLKLYSLQELLNLSNSFQSCLDILTAAESECNKENREILDKYRAFYYGRKRLIDGDDDAGYIGEIQKRKQMLENIKALYYFDFKTNTASGELYNLRKETNEYLNFERYIKEYPDGENLWKTFCSYRREDKYSNSNYFSDGLTNAKIIDYAHMLLDAANEELYKASNLQYSLSSTMNNLLALKEFQPLKDSFSVGNWIRIGIDDKIFTLRLLSYQINFDDIQSIDVEFSTVERIQSGSADIKSVIDSAASMAQSYSGIMHQMDKSKDTASCVQSWIDDGFNATRTKFVDSDKQTIVIDEHGILATSYDDITASYDNCQLKVLNNGLYTTCDNWETVNTGIGKISYIDPETKKQVDDYGIIAKTVVGKLFLGENLGIYNSSGSLKFTENGLEVSGKTSTVVINPDNTDKLFQIKSGEDDVFFTDSDGNLVLKGTITANSGSNIGNLVVEKNRLTYGTFGIDTSSTLANNIALWIGNYNSSLAPFRVTHGGSFYAANATITGGTIGGFTISENAIYKGTSAMTSTTSGIYIGTDGIHQYKDKNAYVTIQNGKLTCIGADIKGKLIANGNIDMVCSSYNEVPFPAIKRYFGSGEGVITEFCGYNGEVLWSHNSEGVGISSSMTVFVEGLGSAGSISAESIIENGEALSSKYLSLSGGTMTGNITLTNGIHLYGKNTEGTTYNLMTISAGNEIHVGSLNENSAIPVLICAEGKRYHFTSDHFSPHASNQQSLGISSNFWSEVYAKKGTINTSDRNQKHDIENISDKYIELFYKLKPKSYMFNDGDRIHIGAISQDVEKSMQEIGITAQEFGGFCKDIRYEYTKYDEEGTPVEASKIPVLDSNGNPAYDYSMRYQEYIFLNIEATQRQKKEIDALKHETAALKQQLDLLQEQITNILRR